MLHDAALNRTALGADEERRTAHRLPHRAELLVQWHHDPKAMVRYRVIDRAEGGYRLQSSLPLLTGMVGTALRLLPEGQKLDQVLMIAWCEPSRSKTGFELGLSIVEPT